MKNHYALVLFSIAVSMLLSNCSNFNNRTIPPDTAVDIYIDYSFSKSDSQLNLQFFNGRLSDLKIIGVLLNNRKIRYEVKSDELIAINKDSITLGKNSFKFIFQLKNSIDSARNNTTDTIAKDYFNLLDIDYIVTNQWPHNSTYFTEGLLFDNAGNLVESTGLENNSKIIFYHPFFKGYKSKDSIINKATEFGEGISIINEQLVQLLWKNNYLKIYSKGNLKFIRDLEYINEGWGLCSNNNTLYASNGTNIIYKLDVSGATTRVTGTISVQDENGIISYINELEWIEGYIFANIWQANLIYIIDPETGYVVGKLDLGIIVEKEKKLSVYIDVLNGIAWNKTNNTLLVTGKYWSNFYELKLNKEIGKTRNVVSLK